jgi:hypothetical protein
MKSFEDFKFKHICDVDVFKIKELTNQITEEQWSENISRQVTFDNHSLTRTYFLADYPLRWELNKPYEGTVLNPESELWLEVSPIVRLLEEHHKGKVGRVMLPKLMATGNIGAHKDGGSYLNVVRRHHIPIITNDQVIFIVDGEQINMREGQVWEINNMKTHEVLNPSDQDRIHLMIDIIPNEYLT